MNNKNIEKIMKLGLKEYFYLNSSKDIKIGDKVFNIEEDDGCGCSSITIKQKIVTNIEKKYRCNDNDDIFPHYRNVVIIPYNENQYNSIKKMINEDDRNTTIDKIINYLNDNTINYDCDFKINDNVTKIWLDKNCSCKDDFIIRKCKIKEILYDYFFGEYESSCNVIKVIKENEFLNNATYNSGWGHSEYMIDNKVYKVK